MGSFGQVSLKDIIKMLEECAEGYELREKTHRYWVLYKEKIFRGLPKGSHSDRGKRSGRAKIEIGHLRSMVRLFEIEECAKRVIEQI